jgi:DNA-binding IclR family transcriptional regulator
MQRTTSTQVVDRVVAILELIAAAGAEGCRLKDIIETLELKRATAYRLVDSLRNHGLVALSRDGHRYQIGIRFLSLGGKASTASTLRDVARPSLLRLASTFGDSFFLFVHDGYENICIDYREGNYPAASFARGVGGRVPLGVGQATIAVLAFLADSERDEILAHNHSILVDVYGLDLERLHKEIANTRDRGFTMGIGSARISDHTGIGVPIFNSSRRVVAAISCSVLTGRFLSDKPSRMINMMRSEAQIIEGQINPLDPILVSPSRR